MNKTKIEWCDSTWNPVTGCRHGCDYCYAQRIAKRFGKKVPDYSGYPQFYGGVHMVESKFKANPYPFLFEPTFHAYRLDEPRRKSKPQTIFACSMADLFGEWVPDEWIDSVFDACKQAPQHTYLFLTKNPSRYGRLAATGKLPNSKNFWYGVTATDHQTAEYASRHLPPVWSYNLFISIEPILGDINLSAMEQYPKWIIIGSMTGPGSKAYQPKSEWVKRIVAWASERNIPVFMKDSIKNIWGPELIREYPSGFIHNV